MKNIDIKVKKRNGKLQQFDATKIHNHIEEACKGINDVYPGEIISFFKVKLNDKMKTTDIQQALILAASDLINEEHPNYQYVAARFVIQDMRKKIYNKKNIGPQSNGWTPRFNYNDLKKRIELGYYDPEILNLFTKEEIKRLLSYINWDNDLNFTYSGITQMLKKYLIKRNKEIIETPQEAFMLIPMYIFGQIDRNITIDDMINLYSDHQDRTNVKSLDLIYNLLIDFKNEGYENFREAMIVNFYQALSNFDLFLSTPPMVGIRSIVRGVTSCAGINVGDSIESIGNASKSMLKLVTNLRAGIGENDGYIRGVGADINKGSETHTGITPYVKLFEDISVSSQQPASGRSGQSTHYYPWFHWEIEDILVLKNNRGYDEKRARKNDHAIVFNKFFYSKLIDEMVNNKENTIALFHINKVDDLYDEIGNNEYFEKKYNELVNDDSVEKKWVSAKRIWNTFWEERCGTSRIYKVNADDFQNHSAFDIPVNFSNLCLEINLPAFPDETHTIYVKNTKEFKTWIEILREKGKWVDIYKIINYGINNAEEAFVKLYIRHPEAVNEFFKIASVTETDQFNLSYKINFGEIFSCILGGLNFGLYGPNKNIDKRVEIMFKNVFLLNWFLDYMIDYQDYVGIKPFEKFTKERRALGISPGNLYNMLAQFDDDYDTQLARNVVNTTMEMLSFTGILSSTTLAMFRGKCKLFNDTKYSKGKFSFDTYNKNVDELVTVDNIMGDNWDELRQLVKEFGMRNSTLFTAVPSSNSSRPGNMISGINPPQGLKYVVKDKQVSVTVLVPDINKYKDFYKRNLAWDHDNLEYWKMIAVIQKWLDQSISLNQYIDYTKYVNESISECDVLETDLFTLKYGIKTLYYIKSKTSDEDTLKNSEEIGGCKGGGCNL